MNWRCAALLCVLACTQPAPAPLPWPDFPRDGAARDALVKARTLREPGPVTDFSPEAVLAAARRQGLHTLPSGERRVYAWVRAQQPKWLLFGTFHDSGPQVDVFRRLVGPGGVPGFTHVALEQLHADGRWQAFDGGQRGDDAVLHDYDALARAHHAHDYTAWKYGYERNVLDLVDARTLPCDAPHTRDERLRELHCLFAIRDKTRPDSRIAMLWGMAHVTREGFTRFLPPQERTLSLYAVGGRWTKDPAFDAKLLVDDLTLVPLGDGEAALLLPGGHVQRAHDDDAAGKPPLVHASGEGTLRIGPHEARLPAELALEAGEYTYAFRSDTGLDIVGSIDVRGETELAFDAVTRETRAVTAPR